MRRQFLDRDRRPDNRRPDNRRPDNRRPDNRRLDNRKPDNRRSDNKRPDNGKTRKSPDSQRPNEREIVLTILTEIRTKDVFSHVAVKNALDLCSEQGMPASHRAFIKRLAEGTVERQIELDNIIAAHMRRGAKSMKPVLRDILRMAVYQICYMDAVPDSAACNEAVNMAKRHKLSALTGFVNGILRSIVREKESVSAPEEITGTETDPKKKLSIKYSMPEWIVIMWADTYGMEKTQALLAALLEIRPVSIRMDERLSDGEREELCREIRERGVGVESGKFFPYCYKLTGTSALKDLPGFAEGKWTVQDESSMFVAEAADVRAGQIVCDVCSAPGGKAMHIATKLKITEAAGPGKVYAFDLSPSKTGQIRKNLERMGLDNVIVGEHDARTPDKKMAQTADILLCDVPCSGLGVMGKKRDIKYHVTPGKIEQLVKLQKEIVSASADILRPGGTFIYSTCTINRAENEEMAEWIAKELGFIPDSLKPLLPEGVISGSDSDASGSHYLQLLPSEHGTDGFFLARFKKPAEDRKKGQ